MSDFAGRWIRRESRSLGSRIKGAVRQEGPIKPRLERAVRQIRIQMARLENASNKLKRRDNIIFRRIVFAMQRHETAYAAVLANELAEIRKMNRMLTEAKLALEQVVLRMNTVRDLGDVVVTLTPAMSVIRNVRSGLSEVLPTAENEIEEIGGLLSGILIDAGQTGGYSINFESANEDAEKVLSEASTVAEQTMKERFPDLPSDLKSQVSRKEASLG